MREAKGFVTDDGTFFEDDKEAALYEAELRLKARLAEVLPNLNQDAFFAVVVGAMQELTEFINAHHAWNPPKTKEPDGEAASGTAEDTTGAGHVSSTEEDLASLLKLPTRGHSDVPDVGSRPRTEKVSDRRKKHGT
jgi:hypothetical protein